MAREPLCLLRAVMKILILTKVDHYIAKALEFERKADSEENLNIKAVFQRQATSYRKLAADYAKKFDRD
jgi:hypothetical protein